MIAEANSARLRGTTLRCHSVEWNARKFGRQHTTVAGIALEHDRAKFQDSATPNRCRRSPLCFEINGYTPHSTLSIDAAQQKDASSVAIAPNRIAKDVLNRNLRLSDYVMRKRPQQKEAAPRAE